MGTIDQQFKERARLVAKQAGVGNARGALAKETNL